jgi:hypothetical protein
MRAVLRIAFALLIAAGLGFQVIRAGRGGDDADPTTTLAEGLAAVGLQPMRTLAPGLIAARAPGCELAVIAASLKIDGSEDGAAADYLTTDHDARYVFLGKATAAPWRLDLFVRWIWQSLRFNLGLRADKPSNRQVLLALPRGCPALAARDWSAVAPGA